MTGPAYDELPEQAFTHPAYIAVHRGIQAAGGARSGLAGPAWLEAVVAQCPETLRGLVTELAVEPLELSSRHDGEARYVASVLAGLQGAMVERQVAELKSRLQRTARRSRSRRSTPRCSATSLRLSSTARRCGSGPWGGEM